MTGPARRQLTLYRASWVLPVTAAPIPDGAVLVEDGVIRAVGAVAEVEAAAHAEAARAYAGGAAANRGEAGAGMGRRSGARVREVRLDDCVLLPGLVNVHAHPELTAFRGLLEDRPFPDWIAGLLARKRAAALEPDDYLTSAVWGCVEAARAGITTLAATEDSDAGLRALVSAGLRGIAYREVFAPDPAHAAPALRSLEDNVAAMQKLATDLVGVGVSPHAPYTVSDDLYRGVAELAAAERLPLACHAAESVAEQELVRDGAGPFAESLRRRGIAVQPRAGSTIELLDRLGVLALRPLLVHCVHVDGADLERIAAAGAAIAHCPIANARLAHGVAPLPRFLEAGIRTGLGTDSVASNNRLDLLEEARFTSLTHRALSGRPDLLPAGRLLELVTLAGARTLGLEDRIGSLEPGKQADLCAVSLAGPHARPIHDPLVGLFHSARAADVVLTVVRGRTIFERGRVLSVDEAELRRQVDNLARRIAAAVS
ncbi:MAG: amidohydrolase family protein [Gemmatimonadetes bacterium]|nr:amidohydrolase family protein [Gemmatimonadota bacterium]